MTEQDPGRYSRQIRFAGVGDEGQRRLRESHAAIVGCGALGTVQAEQLVRAGVGRITIIDRDFVEESNLQRQILFTERDAAESLPKAIAARNRLRQVNSSVEIEAIVADLHAGNASELLAEADVLLDATDNFETRYLLNDFAVHSATPWIYGAAVGSYGIAMAVIPGRTACFRCVYPEPPSGAQPTCETAGVLNSVTGLIGSIQSGFALQILAGHVDKVPALIVTSDLWSGLFRAIDQPRRDPECPACGRREFPYLEGVGRAPVSLCGNNAVQIHDRTRPLDLQQLHRQLQPLGEVRSNEFALRFLAPPFEMTIFPDGRAIVKGTTEVGVARSLYSRYIGN